MNFKRSVYASKKEDLMTGLMTEAKALEILSELIKKPEISADQLPTIWKQILDVHNTAFNVVVEVVKKKRRKQANPNIGWPAGIKRADYSAWKEFQINSGVTENINPQAFKRFVEAGGTTPITRGRIVAEQNTIVPQTPPKKRARKTA
jgi:hypothetical protein